MKKRLFVLIFLLSSSISFAEDISIVVNFGKYLSAKQGAFDEANVNWWNDDFSDDTVCTECFAATELRHYLCKMTRKDEGDPKSFPLVDDDKIPTGDLIIVGSDASKQLSAVKVDRLGRDGFRIKSFPNDGRKILLIGGGSRIGTLYGVYAFLERLGVRWFAPSEVNEYVPLIKFDRLPEMDITERPAFSTRGFWAWESRGNDDFFHWMARNRLNLWNTAEGNRHRLKKLGLILTCGGHHHEDWFLGPRKEYPYNHPKFPADDGKPADPYPVSPHYEGDVNNNKRLEYCEAHPEWYGLRKGKRSFDIHGGGGDNFCTSNKHACDELVKNIVGALIGGEAGEKNCPLLSQSTKKPWADAHWHHADSINFWTLDGGKWCECEQCKALGIPTDRNLLLVHRLRQEITRAMDEGRLKRNVQVAFLAYADVIQPPTRPLPTDFDYENCIATFFPIGRCYVHCLDDPNCTELNARYIRHYAGWALEEDRHYNGQLFIGEYYNVSGFKCLPIVFRTTMSRDIPYYHRTGARHFHYMHCTTKNWGTKALTNYQMAKMLWDPSLQVSDLLSDYFNKRYGPAEGVMTRCYDHLEQALCNVRVLKYDLSRRLDQDAAELFPRKHMRYEAFHPETDDGPDFTEMKVHIDEAKRLIESAAALATTSAEEAARIAEDRGNLMYAWNTIHFYDHIVQTTLLKRAGNLQAARKEFTKAKELAAAMKEDTESCSYSSSHASAKDSFEASYITGAYHRLMAELGADDPNKIKIFAPAEGLTIYGSEFALGGQVLYHTGFRSGGRWISPKGNYVYAQRESPYHMMLAKFRVDEIPEGAVKLALVGMSSPKEPGGIVPIRITLNETIIFQGEGPFPEGKLSRQEHDIPAGALVKGLNQLKIENMIKSGRRGSRPWFGVDRVEVLPTSQP